MWRPSRAITCSSTATSSSPSTQVSDPSARNPMSSTAAPSSDQRWRDASAAASSRPGARPLIQIMPKLRTVAERGS